jgi:DNA-binding Lrp family transcriptional regulator
MPIYCKILALEAPMLDATDRKLLELLQADGQLSNQDLAERCALSAPACWRRVRRLQDAGVIRQYVALLDAPRIGFGLLAFAFVDLENHHADTVAEFDRFVAERPEVLECHMLSGNHDYLLRIVAADMQAYEEFLRLRLLPTRSVRSVNTSFSMNAKKTTTALPIAEIAPRAPGRYHQRERSQP